MVIFKSKVHVNRSNTIEDLKERIRPTMSLLTLRDSPCVLSRYKWHIIWTSDLIVCKIIFLNYFIIITLYYFWNKRLRKIQKWHSCTFQWFNQDRVLSFNHNWQWSHNYTSNDVIINISKQLKRKKNDVSGLFPRRTISSFYRIGSKLFVLTVYLKALIWIYKNKWKISWVPI